MRCIVTLGVCMLYGFMLGQFISNLLVLTTTGFFCGIGISFLSEKLFDSN